MVSSKKRLTFMHFLGLLFPVSVAMLAVVWGAAFLLGRNDPDIVTESIFGASPFVRQGWWGWLLLIGGVGIIVGLLGQLHRLTKVCSFTVTLVFFYGGFLALDGPFAILWAPLLIAHALSIGCIYILTTVRYLSRVGAK